MKKVKLGEVTINIDNRRKPLNNLQRSEKSFSKKYPYCGANNIIDFIDEYIFDENEEILCIAEDGGNWGKDEECTYVMNEKCWVNNHAHVLKMKTGVDINYIKLILDYLDLTPYITGSTRGKLTKSSLDKIEINLPNYHTQISISKKISDIQKLITKKEEQIQKYNELVKSRFNEMFGDPVFNEMRWRRCKLKDISIGKLAYGSGASAIDFSGLRYIRITDIDECGNLKLDKKSPSHYDEKYLLNTGDILFARSGATVGKTFLYSKEKYGPALYAGYLIRLIPNLSLVNPVFVYHFTNTKFYNDFIAKVQNTVAQPNINAKQYSELDFILPPLSLQNEFADFVAQVDKSQFACGIVIKLWRNGLKSSII